MVGMFLLLSACSTDRPASLLTDTATATPTAPVTVPLSDVALLRRLTLDLNSRLPTEDELEAVEADGAALVEITEALLADAQLEDRLADMMVEQWMTRVDVFNIGHADYMLDDEMEYPLERAVGNEPLRLMAYVAARDLPWTDIVTADYTLVNDVLLDVWPLEEAPELEESGVEGWRPARYTDDRPAGGVVMTNGLWWRYYSAPNNYNRTRAAAISRLLLCEDFLLRPISFSASSLLDRESLNEATRTETACVGCHATLDPLASAMFGFWWFDLYDTAEMTSYHAEREFLGEYYLEMGPAWFGQPMQGPADLGGMIANDPRFVSCTVERAAAGLWRRSVTVDDFAVLQDAQAEFEASDLRYTELLRALIATEEYTAGELLPEADDDDADRIATGRMMSAEQLADTVEDLTGYRWSWQGFDQLDNDSYGFRTLLGGVDGVSVSVVQQDPSLSRALVIQRLAQAAAWEVVEDIGTGLLDQVSATTTPADAEFTDQLITLHRRMHGSSPDDARLAEDVALWEAVEATAGPEAAWRSVVAVLIRDPDFWMY